MKVIDSSQELTTSLFWQDEEACFLAGRGIPEPVSELELPLGAILFGSSGSSGVEKWVIHSRETLLVSARSINEHLRISSEDVLGVMLPFYHVGGFGVYARAYAAGARCVELSGKWNVGEAISFLRKHKISVTSMVPTQIYDLVMSGMQCPSTLRAVVVGGGSLDLAIGRQARVLGWPVLQSYGLSEAGSQVATSSLDTLEREFTNEWLSILPIWKTEINDSKLSLSGKALCHGILTNEGYQDHQQFITQDKVQIRDGKLSFHGRLDRTVKVRGELVNLDTLENQLFKHFQTRIVIVFKEDERAGVSLYGFSEQEVEGVNAYMPPYAQLKRMESIKKFPLSALGKLDRRALTKHLNYND